MRMVGTHPGAGMAEGELIRLAAAVESSTRHPVADAITAAAKARGIEVPSAWESSTEAGSGARAQVDGRQVSQGKVRIYLSQNIGSIQVACVGLGC